MAHDDNQDNRDSAFSAITLGDLLGRSGLPRLDDRFGDAPTQPFTPVPAQRSASPYVMPRRKTVTQSMVPIDGVEPRADRTFTRMSEPGRRPITSTGVALAVGSLAGATIMFGSPSIAPPDVSAPGQSDSGQNGDGQPVALAPAAFPSPLLWAAGLGLPPSAQSRGVVPSSGPAFVPSDSGRSGAHSAPPEAVGWSPRTLGGILAHNSAPTSDTAPAAPHIGGPSTTVRKLAAPSRSNGGTSAGQPQARSGSDGKRSADNPRTPSGSALSSLTPRITADDASHGASRSDNVGKDSQDSSTTSSKTKTSSTSKSTGTSETSGTARTAKSSRTSKTSSSTRRSSSGAGTRSASTRSASKPSAARPSTSTSKRSTGGSTKSSSEKTKRSTSSRVAGSSSKSRSGSNKHASISSKIKSSSAGKSGSRLESKGGSTKSSKHHSGGGSKSRDHSSRGHSSSGHSGRGGRGGR